MKRVLTLLVIVAMVLGVVTTGAARINVTVDGQQQSFDPAPVNISGRVLVPMRALFETLGADVDWDNNTRTAIGVRDGVTVRIPIGSTRPTVDGKIITIDVPAEIVEGRTFIPLRFVGEALGDGVDWDGATRTVIVTRKGSPKDPKPAGGDLVVHFLDVGQGDSILLQSPAGKVILVDAGPRSAGEKIVSYLKQAGITSIDIFVATHAHEDHIGGFQAVADAFAIKKVYDAGYPHTTKTYEDMLTTIDQKDIGFEIARAGGEISIDPALDITILHPGELVDDVNNNSIVLKLTYNDISFMLTGDAEDKAEFQMLLQSSTKLDSDILKIGHHGSRTSTSDGFLTAVSPGVAVIQLGVGNSYGHPHPETLDKLTRAGVKIYRTDIAGDIVVTSDGTAYQISGIPYTHLVAPEPVFPPLEGEIIVSKYVGSLKSDKYHYRGCRYAESILPANLVGFADQAEANAAGYLPCGVCKP